jgi:hypothetical protein
VPFGVVRDIETPFGWLGSASRPLPPSPITLGARVR